MIKYHTWQHKHKTMVKDELLRKLGTYGTFFVFQKGYYIVLLFIQDFYVWKMLRYTLQLQAIYL